MSFYIFEGSAGDVVTIEVLAITPGLDLGLSLNSPSQQQLANNASSGNALTPGDAGLSFVLPVDGIYTILVSSTNGTPGDFLIRLFGVTAASGGIVDSKTPVEGALDSNAPALLYVIIPNADGQTVVTILPDDPAAVLHVQAMSDLGATVADVTGSGVLVVVLPPGTDPFGVVVTLVSEQATGITVQTGSGLPGTPSDGSAPSGPPPGPGVVETPEVQPPAATCTVTPVIGIGTSIRSGPGADFPPFAVAQAGMPLIPVGQSGTGWFRINFQGSVEGWISEQTVSVEGDCASLPVVGSGGTVPAVSPTASATLAPGQPTATFTLTPSATTPVTNGVVQATPTFTPTATSTQPAQQVAPTPSYTPSYTPTTPPAPPSATYTPSYTPTSTIAPPTPTYTPSYTPTTPPAAQVAPPDANFNNPLNLQLDTTGSVTDFVSYPGGDTQDRVRWDIIGMNQNPSLSGGRARLTLAVSCFGTGIENVTFFTGGQTFTCGQTIVDREVTYDSRTGQVTITAVGGQGTYVQWVLTGTAVRVN
ncbi:MAG: SH3 domain-containing protein [Anaerolineae bacterium]|nr:SH3 domain-containing protein [Anaerolineae bacterium]